MDLTDAEVLSFSRELTGQVDQFEHITVELAVPRFPRRPAHFNAGSSLEFERSISGIRVVGLNLFGDRLGSGAPSPRELVEFLGTEDNMQQIRQGDILLRKVANTSAKKEDLVDGMALIAGNPATMIEPEEGRVILARGERTGHAHAVDAEVSQLWEAFGELRLVVTDETELVHEDHPTLTVEPGVYEVILQEDWRPGANVTRTSMPDIDA